MSRDQRLPLAIPAAGPLFEGHFPGRPILPAIGLLDLAVGALAAPGAAPPLRGIVSLRLRQLVAPGEILRIQAGAPDADGRTRIEARRDAAVVAQGVLLLGPPAPGAGDEEAARAPRPAIGNGMQRGGPRPASALPDLDDLLPHRPPMRMVEGIESASDDAVVCAVRLPERNAFAMGGTAPALVALEMAAQAAAAGEALRRYREAGQAGARIGYLVGARNVRFAGTRVPAGETLVATVRLSGIALPLCTYDFEVARQGEVVASGSLSTWLTATDA